MLGNTQACDGLQICKNEKDDQQSSGYSWVKKGQGWERKRNIQVTYIMIPINVNTVVFVLIVGL